MSTGVFQRLLVLFKGFLLSFQKSFFCLSAWRSHIVPYRNHFCKPFLHFFRLFLRFVYIIQFFALFQGMFRPFFHHFCAKTAAAQKVQRLCGGVTSQPALCDDPPHTGQVDPTQQVLQYDQHGILLSDRPFQPNSPFSKNRSSFVKLPPPKRLSSGPRL